MDIENNTQEVVVSNFESDHVDVNGNIQGKWIMPMQLIKNEANKFFC